MKYILISLFLTLWLSLEAYSKTNQVNDLKFMHLTTDQGLSSSEVTKIIQDEEGFIWIATADGLNRYDGRSFKNYRRIKNDSTSLPENNIKSLFVDSSGDLWIVLNRKGVSRYDKMKDQFVNYRSVKPDSTTILDDMSISITEDSLHNIWIASYSGLSRYNRNYNNFTRLPFNSDPVLLITDEGSRSIIDQISNVKVLNVLEEYKGTKVLLSELTTLFSSKIGLKEMNRYIDLFRLTFSNDNLGNNDIRHIITDADGTIYIGYNDGLISAFNPKLGHFQHKRFLHPDDKDLIDFFITGICIYNEEIWVGTYGDGIWIYNKQLDSWSKFNQLNDPFIRCILKDSFNNIWIGGSTSGLVLYNSKEHKISSFVHSEENKYSISSNNITCIFEDVQQNLWIGTDRGDINFTDKQNPFRSLNALTYDDISSLIVDLKNRLWIGYYTKGGIEIIRQETGTKEYIAPGEKGLGEGTIQCMFEDSRGNIWVGTYLSGLHRYDESKDQFVRYKHVESDSNSIGGINVRAICEDHEGNLWIAIHGAGVDCYDPQNDIFTHYQHNFIQPENSIQSNWTMSVYCDRQDRIWVGTIDGLCLIDKKTGMLHEFVTDEKESSSISSNFVFSVYQDRKDRIWVGTSYGLNLFDPVTETFQLFSQESGLSNDNISGITEDQKGNLWVSTYKGLTCFNPDQLEFKNYKIADGLKTDEFIVPSGIASKNGELFFGGRKGLVIFNPDNLKYNSFIPPVYLTNFKLFNQTVKVTQKQEKNEFQLDTIITFANELILNYNQNAFTFEFVALNYLQPQKNYYSYQLEGFDEEWNMIGNKNEASYTNLKSGEYVFRIKSSNNDGVWNQVGDTLKITIHPPWWRTLVAYILYLITGIGSVVWFMNVAIQRARMRQTNLLNVLKLRFFTNISHEFKTPLTLIKTPIENLLSTTKDKQLLFQYSIINKNMQHLLRLINQLMDVSKLENGGTKLEVVNEDLMALLKEIFNSFQFEAEKRSIKYQFSTSNDELFMLYDPNKLDKVFYNLLSNAFKFTPGNGRIAVNIEKRIKPGSSGNSLEYIEISVQDSGKGIPELSISKIFDRFYQVDSTRNMQGTGIGLSLAKEFVELHHGTISVESELGRGTRFVVELPIQCSKLPNFEIVHNLENELIESKINQLPAFNLESHLHIVKTQKERSQRLKMLIIEDHAELNHLIEQQFVDDFDTTCAFDGAAGLQSALELIPDLIISDIMMPELDGFELCRQLKQEVTTSHIPIILLTAKTSDGEKIKGLDIGADDYISKPFSVSVLKARVQNLIESRQLLRKQFSKLPNIESIEKLSKLDKELLNKTFISIEKHMSNPEFEAHQFARELGLSRAQLYRKIQALTGFTVNEYIRNVRLKEAAKLLVDEHCNISDAAYSVGFGSASYFSKCFTQYYGVSPTRFVNAALGKGVPL